MPRPYWLRRALATVTGEVDGLGGAGILAGAAFTIAPEDPGAPLLVLLTGLGTGLAPGVVTGLALDRLVFETETGRAAGTPRSVRI